MDISLTLQSAGHKYAPLQQETMEVFFFGGGINRGALDAAQAGEPNLLKL